ncbi:hypothetical protein [Amycolatopsis methanolica]|uniref:hypothetical protein n=1 Tax=Amycolatopsis methanolica TaxID=1814 RepID=UPI00343313E7
MSSLRTIPLPLNVGAKTALLRGIGHPSKVSFGTPEQRADRVGLAELVDQVVEERPEPRAGAARGRVRGVLDEGVDVELRGHPLPDRLQRVAELDLGARPVHRALHPRGALHQLGVVPERLRAVLGRTVRQQPGADAHGYRAGCRRRQRGRGRQHEPERAAPGQRPAERQRAAQRDHWKALARRGGGRRATGSRLSGRRAEHRRTAFVHCVQLG